MPEPKWYADHANLALVVRFMFEASYSDTAIVYALEKPWKFEREWDAAQRWNKGLPLGKAIDIAEGDA